MGEAFFDDMAEVHDGDAVGEVADDAEVVGDEEVREVEFALDVLEQIEYLGLDGDIEGAGAFIADDDVGFDGEGAGQADALALAARELVRVAAEGGGGETDFGHDGFGAGAAFGGIGADAVCVHAFGDAFADGEAGIEAGEGILEDNLKIFPVFSHLVFTNLS